MLFVAAQN